MKENQLLLKDLLEHSRLNFRNTRLHEYHNTYHRTIKMKPVDVKDNTYIDFKKDVNVKDPKFKVEDHVRFLNTKIFLLKDTHQICL